jgi:hypothetical protein
MRNVVIHALHGIGLLVSRTNVGGGGRREFVMRGGDQKRMQNIGPEPEEEKPLIIVKHRMEDNIKMDVK